MFVLRRLQSNPPRSLWLQHIHWMCCLTRRAHTVVPPLHSLREPTTSASRGATLSTHIEGYRPRLMPLVHGRKNPHSPVHLYNPSSSAFASSPPCGSRSVLEKLMWLNQTDFDTVIRQLVLVVKRLRKLNEEQGKVRFRTRPAYFCVRDG